MDRRWGKEQVERAVIKRNRVFMSILLILLINSQISAVDAQGAGYTLTMDAQNGTYDVEIISGSSIGPGVYEEGSQLKVFLHANGGYYIESITGDIPEGPGTQNPVTLTMDSDKSITVTALPIDTSSTIIVDQAWINTHGPAPYVLDQSGKMYILQTGVTTDGAAFVVNAANITFDLNGYTITYDDVPGGLPNYDFTLGDGEIPQDWDLSLAPAAKRLSDTLGPKDPETTYCTFMVNGWYLQVQNTTEDQTIVSSWVDLPKNSKMAAYFLRDSSWKYHIQPIRFEVEYTDGVDMSTVASVEGESNNLIEFTSSPNPGQYRLKLTYIEKNDDLASSPTWQPGCDYNIGDIVKPSAAGKLVYRVLTDSGSSGDTEPKWGVFASSQTVDGGLKWLAYYATTTHTALDLFDIRTTGVYGIGRGAKWNGGPNFTVKNGKIRQGRGGGFRCHAIYTYGMGDGLVVDNVEIYNWGLESESIHTTGSPKIINTSIANDNPFIFNRHQLSAAISLSYTSGSEISNCRISCGKGWGAIYINDGLNHLIANNELKTRCTETNHHAIVIHLVEQSLIKNNVIEGDPGQGILVTSSAENEVANNTIIIRSARPSYHLDFGSLDAIRLNDYGNDTIYNSYIHDNHIEVYGTMDGAYKALEKDMIVNGICNLGTGPGNVYDNNYIKAIKIDPFMSVRCLEPGSLAANEVTYRNNTFESNYRSMVFVGYPGYSLNTKLISNTFSKNIEYPNEGYITIGNARCGNSINDTGVSNTHFIDTRLSNGALLSSVDNASWSNFSYYVDWYLNLSVKDAAGPAIDGAFVVIKNRINETVFTGTTDPNGKIDKIILNEYNHYGNGFKKINNYTYSNPHVIEVSSPGYGTVQEPITITESTERSITLIPADEPADINGDSKVNILDLILVAKDFGKTTGYNPNCDVNKDGKIDIRDLIFVALHIGK